MPTYEVTDPKSGRVLQLTGDTPPTEQDLDGLFAQHKGAPSPDGFMAKAKGVGEAVLSTGLGAVNWIPSGVIKAAGVVSGQTKEGTELGDFVQDKLSYQPKTEIGKKLSGYVAAPFEYISEKSKEAADWTYDKTGSPLLATAVRTAGEAIPFVAPVALAKGIKGIKGRLDTAFRPLEGVIPETPGVPTSLLPEIGRDQRVSPEYNKPVPEPPKIEAEKPVSTPPVEPLPETQAKTPPAEIVQPAATSGGKQITFRRNENGAGEIISVGGKDVGTVMVGEKSADRIKLEWIMLDKEQRGQKLGTDVLKKILTDNPDVNVIEGGALPGDIGYWKKIGALTNSENFAITRQQVESGKSPSPLPEAGAKGGGVSDTIQQAFSDWREGRAYIDNNGNYRIKAEGSKKGRIASWNKEVKKEFENVGDFHKAAQVTPKNADIPFDKTEPVKQEIPKVEQPIPEHPQPVETPANFEFKSRVYDRLQQEHPEELKGDVTYNKINLEKDAEMATDLITNDKQKAYRLAMNLEESPDVTNTAVNIAMSEKALTDGNLTLYGNLVKNRSLAQTRRGQEIVSEKGSVTDNDTSRYVKELVAARLEKVGKNYFDDVKGKLAKKSNKEKAFDKIDKEVEKAQAKMSNKMMDIKEAQSIIDRLMCK